VLLYPTAVPNDLVLPPVDVDAVFGAELVARAERFERFLYVDWILAQVALFAVLVVYAKRGAVFARESAAGPIGTGMLLGMLGLAIVWLVLLPFRLAAHWWSRRYDVTDLDYFTFVLGDWAVLAAQFVSLCLALLITMALARAYGDHWWLPGAAVFALIALVFTWSAPFLAAPTEKLAEPALVAAATEYERELGLEGDIPLRVEEVSLDTDQANAYAFGLGPSRTVVFWDTMLLPPFSTDEQKTVLAHELAHHSQLHLPKGLGWFLVFAIPGAWILMRATRSRGGMGNPAAIPLALVVVAALQLVLAPVSNLVSRRMEAEADWKALEVTQNPAALEQLMAGLSDSSLGDPDPPAWTELFLGTHPALADRVAMARAWAERNDD
jgi:STE24 endopeptidase